MISQLSLIGPKGNAISVATAGTGPTLMLLHGFPLDHRLWLAQLGSLADFYHVVAPEFRGFGGSATSHTAYTLRDLAEDVEFVRQHLAGEQPMHLAGLSMGGYVAFEYWHMHRQHLRSLSLLNTKPSGDDTAARQGRLTTAEHALAAGTWEAVQPMLPKLLSAVTLSTRPQVVAAVESMMRRPTAPAVAAAQQAMADRRDFTSLLPSMRLPVLVATGEHDPLAPPVATQAWAASLPDAKFVQIPEAGHLPPLETPEAITDLLRSFLF